MSSPPESSRAAVLTRQGGQAELELHDEWPRRAPVLGVEPDFDSLGEPVAVYQ
jgi:hypothetical protein